MSETQISVELRSEIEELSRLAGVVAEFARTGGLPADAAQALHLALEEVVTNVIRHAYRERAGAVRVRLAARSGEVVAEIEDDGPAFDPLARPAPDLDLPLEERPIGGLGIHLVRNLMDAVAYRRCGVCNLLTLTKRWTNPAN
jgi:anti-sigma regulatory factor (Ser/Thr protein kinase)